MHKLKSALPAALGLALVLLPAAVEAGVEVEFVDPQGYSDIGDYGLAPAPLPQFERHLQQLGDGCLARDQDLRIRILDIDLAGRQEWWRGPGYADLRVMRDITWPRIELEYRWFDGDGMLRQQQRERLSDRNYLMPGHRIAARDESYGYDKAMLTRWFEDRFCS